MRHKTRTDSRTVKTRERIWETFRTMILEMDYNDITVTELTSRVGIHRKTFYLHYECIDSLFLELEDKITAQLNDALVKSMTDSSKICFKTTKQYFIALIETDSLLYKRLLFSESYQPIYNHVFDRIPSLLTPYMNKSLGLTDEEAFVAINFILNGYFEVIRKCQKNNIDISDDKLDDIVLSLIHPGIRNMQTDHTTLPSSLFGIG